MSGYFDALMRSSGMTIGEPKPAHIPARVVGLDDDPGWSETATEARTMPVSSTPPQEAVAPIRVTRPVEPAAPARMSDAFHHRADPDSTPVRTPAASDPAGDSRKIQPEPSAETAKRDLGQTLVRAAMRWVAAGTPPIAEATPVDPAPEPPVPASREGTSRIAMASVPAGDDDEAQAQPPATTPAISTTPNPSSRERRVTAPLAVRSARAALAPPPPAARLRRDETVEVSIGAIHVRVDAPPAQTAARSAAPPPAAAQRAASATPQRSALSRRVLRRV